MPVVGCFREYGHIVQSRLTRCHVERGEKGNPMGNKRPRTSHVDLPERSAAVDVDGLSPERLEHQPADDGQSKQHTRSRSVASAAVQALCRQTFGIKLVNGAPIAGYSHRRALKPAAAASMLAAAAGESGTWPERHQFPSRETQQERKAGLMREREQQLTSGGPSPAAVGAHRLEGTPPRTAVA